MLSGYTTTNIKHDRRLSLQSMTIYSLTCTAVMLVSELSRLTCTLTTSWHYFEELH